MMATVETLRRAARKSPPTCAGLSAAELQARIDTISADLKGSGISPGERIAMNEDRHVYRAALARLAGETA